MLLTVAIPTYQCPVTFYDSFYSIESQITDDLLEIVEILVVDNGSTDNPMNMVAELVRETKVSVRFLKNEDNLGYDRNILECLSAARGKFVKFLADDDVLLNGGVKDLLTVINLHPNLGAILQPFVDLDPLASEKIFETLYSVHEDFESTVVASAGVYGQISTVSLNRDASLSTFNSNMVGSNFIHVSMFFTVAQLLPVAVFQNKAIAIRRGSPNFSQSDFINLMVPMRGFATFDYIHSTKFGKVKKKLVKEYQSYVLGRLTLIKGLTSHERIRILFSYLSNCGGRPKFWLFGLPLILLPRKARALGSKFLVILGRSLEKN
jgi:glycosyltransferase involved in cell wall biosynthesis